MTGGEWEKKQKNVIMKLIPSVRARGQARGLFNKMIKMLPVYGIQPKDPEYMRTRKAITNSKDPAVLREHIKNFLKYAMQYNNNFLLNQS